MENDKKTEEQTVERRITSTDDIEFRIEPTEDGKSERLVGYAAKFNKMSTVLFGFTERIMPGAFAKALNTCDVRALVNHNPDALLGRTKSGTLRLSENKQGLQFEIDLPDTQAARDTRESIKRGDMTGCSFSFSIKPGGDR
ncbi:hypothetical protein LCGC14_2820640 [marine sediment metagenome]|uniref:Prohead serine protease domain-containing protein n=1 Tax=marine sediment metagenome TaxID=412755 RepID=A0A0F8YH40_9ZZZZ